MIQKNKINNNTIIFTIITAMLICVIVYLLIPKSDVSADIKASIDSLTVENKRLLQSQENINKSINAYEYKINKIDSEINNIQNKTTTINRYYTAVGQQVDNYTPPEIDSFFKKRYNY